MLPQAAALLARHLDLERLHDSPRNLVLHREQVGGRGQRVWPRPDRHAIVHPDQLRCNAHLIAGLLDGPDQHVIHTELAANLLRIGALLPRRQEGPDAKVLHARDPGNNRVRNPDPQEADLLRARQHVEGQHGEPDDGSVRPPQEHRITGHKQRRNAQADRHAPRRAARKRTRRRAPADRSPRAQRRRPRPAGNDPTGLAPGT